MDGSQFDTWTRRRFGLAAGGAALASILGIANLPEAEAKKRKKKKKKKCRKLGETCDINRKNEQCCNNEQDCGQVQGLGNSNFCCKPHNSSCSFNEDCCGNRRCRSGSCQNP